MKESLEKGLEHLQVWQKAIQFALFVCKKVIDKFPDSEKYALSSQIRRSAQSIPANIAEGHGRFYYQDNVRFAYISRGSLEETYSHLIFAQEMGYVTQEQFQEAREKYSELLKMINGYINYLKKTKMGIKEPGAEYVVIQDNPIDED